MTTEKKFQPITENNAGIANSYMGKLINFNNPTPDMICLNDIAKGLSNICRFGGQINDFYSVAQHTLLVWRLAPGRLKPIALLHDASEAFLGDVVKPFKILLGDTFKEFEDKFEKVIFEKYQVDGSLMAELKTYDEMALKIESDYFHFGKLDFLQKFYEINEEIPFETPYKQLLSLLRSQFMQYDFA